MKDILKALGVGFGFTAACSLIGALIAWAKIVYGPIAGVAILLVVIALVISFCWYMANR